MIDVVHQPGILSTLPSMVCFVIFHVESAADDEGHPLMDMVRNDIQDARITCRRFTTRFFSHERERRGFIEQAQFSMWLSGVLPVLRVEEYAAVHEVAMEICDQTAYIAAEIGPVLSF